VVNPGDVEFLESSPDEYLASITGEGIYYFTVQVTDAESNVHTDTVAVVVLDQAQLDQLLKAKWDGMRQALIDGNIESAAAYLKSDRMTAYSDFFQSIPNDQISNVIPGQDKMELVEMLEGKARYVTEIDIVVDGVPTTASSYVIFTQDVNGLWKVSFF